MSNAEYTLHTRRQKLVDVLLFFHHRRTRAILVNLAKSLASPLGIVLEIGSGAKSRKTLFSMSTFISTDLVRGDTVDILQTAAHLSFRDQTAQLVLCENVLEHVFEPERVIQEIHRVLCRDGLLFLVTPFLFPLHDAPHDFFRYTEYSLRRLLRDFSEMTLYKILWLPWPKPVFGRFVLYYIAIAKR